MGEKKAADGREESGRWAGRKRGKKAVFDKGDGRGRPAIIHGNVCFRGYRFRETRGGTSARDALGVGVDRCGGHFSPEVPVEGPDEGTSGVPVEGPCELPSHGRAGKRRWRVDGGRFGGHRAGARPGHGRRRRPGGDPETTRVRGMRASRGAHAQVRPLPRRALLRRGMPAQPLEDAQTRVPHSVVLAWRPALRCCGRTYVFRTHLYPV